MIAGQIQYKHTRIIGAESEFWSQNFDENFFRSGGRSRIKTKMFEKINISPNKLLMHAKIYD